MNVVKNTAPETGVREYVLHERGSLGKGCGLRQKALVPGRVWASRAKIKGKGLEYEDTKNRNTATYRMSLRLYLRSFLPWNHPTRTLTWDFPQVTALLVMFIGLRLYRLRQNKKSDFLTTQDPVPPTMGTMQCY